MSNCTSIDENTGQRCRNKSRTTLIGQFHHPLCWPHAVEFLLKRQHTDQEFRQLSCALGRDNDPCDFKRNDRGEVRCVNCGGVA